MGECQCIDENTSFGQDAPFWPTGRSRSEDYLTYKDVWVAAVFVPYTRIGTPCALLGEIRIVITNQEYLPLAERAGPRMGRIYADGSAVGTIEHVLQFVGRREGIHGN